MSKLILNFNGNQYHVKFDCSPPGEIIKALAEAGELTVYERGVQIFTNVKTTDTEEAPKRSKKRPKATKKAV